MYCCRQRHFVTGARLFFLSTARWGWSCKWFVVRLTLSLFLMGLLLFALPFCPCPPWRIIDFGIQNKIDLQKIWPCVGASLTPPFHSCAVSLVQHHVSLCTSTNLLQQFFSTHSVT